MNNSKLKSRMNKSSIKNSPKDSSLIKRRIGVKQVKKANKASVSFVEPKKKVKSTSEIRNPVDLKCYKKPSIRSFKRESLRIAFSEMDNCLRSALYSLKSLECKDNSTLKLWVNRKATTPILAELQSITAKLALLKGETPFTLNLETLEQKGFHDEFLDMYKGFSDSWRKEIDQLKN